MVRADCTACHEFEVLTRGSAGLPPSRISMLQPAAVPRPVGSAYAYRIAGGIMRIGLTSMLRLSRRFDMPSP